MRSKQPLNDEATSIKLVAVKFYNLQKEMFIATSHYVCTSFIGESRITNTTETLRDLLLQQNTVDMLLELISTITATQVWVL